MVVARGPRQRPRLGAGRCWAWPNRTAVLAARQRDRALLCAAQRHDCRRCSRVGTCGSRTRGRPCPDLSNVCRVGATSAAQYACARARARCTGKRMTSPRPATRTRAQSGWSRCALYHCGDRIQRGWPRLEGVGVIAGARLLGRLESAPAAATPGARAGQRLRLWRRDALPRWCQLGIARTAHPRVCKSLPFLQHVCPLLQ